MIDEGKLARVVAGEAIQIPKKHRVTELGAMTVAELLSLRASIEALLPAVDLSQMDLEKELVLQFLKVKALQETVLEPDSGIPANQIAQVSNSVAQTLNNLVSMQAKLHTAERLKEIEARLIKTLNKLPPEHLQEFFDWYEAEGA